MVSLFRFLLVSLVFTLGTTSTGHAASFDCSKASTETEIAICNDPELSALDELIAISYSVSRKISLDKNSLRNTQIKWILERDKVSGNVDTFPHYPNGNLYAFMLDRFRFLSSKSIGSSYEDILNLLSKSGSIEFEVENSKRVLLLTQSNPYHGNYHNALFFDADDKLVKVFIGADYGFDGPCEDSFSFFEDTNTKTTSLGYTMSCGVNGHHGWEEIRYTMAPGCIQLQNVERSSGQPGLGDAYGSSVGSWNLNDDLKICLEEQNYNLGTDGLLLGTHEGEYPQSFGGLLAFFTDYWIEPPVQSVRPEFEGCSSSTDAIVLADVKLTNLYAILANSGTLLNGNVVIVPDDTGFVGYQEISTSRYSDLINDYEKNKKVYDLFLPVIKILDTDGGLNKLVSNVLKFGEGGGASDPNICSWFKATNGDFYRNTYFISYGFWKRRDLDGTTDQTLEILRKLQKILAD